MRYLFLLTLASSLTLWAGTAAPLDHVADDFIGPGLDGWEGVMKYWTYKDGVLTGSSHPGGLKGDFNSFLCSKRKYKDLEMSFQVRIKGLNSGVQVRSEIANREMFAVKGTQCDMGGQYWGGVYYENPMAGKLLNDGNQKEVAKVVKKDDFNDYSIRCVGKHLTIKLNGLTTVDQDFPEMPDEGIVAFQLHRGGPMEVTFRNIVFKDLSSK